MAILSGFPGLEVAVTVNGDALHEYDLPDDIEEIMTDGSTIKYIEARPGTEFAIRCEIEPTFEYSENDLYLNVTVDNYLAHAKFMSTGVQTETLTGPLMASGKKLIERNWVFSTLKTGQRLHHGFMLNTMLNITQLVALPEKPRKPSESVPKNLDRLLFICTASPLARKRRRI